jgi:hypothetical protein
MTTTEEIVVSGENFIERRIFVYPQDGEIQSLQRCVYSDGYHRGWTCGFFIGLGVFALALLCIWVLIQL